MAEHITEVYFLNVPLESDYKNTLYFTSKQNQESYFKGKVKKQYTSGNTMSYQRKDGYIRVDEDMDTLLSLGINYVMYQNKAFSNKYFYAFITDMKYVSPGRTDVFIKTDVMQTWFFEHKVKPSFVEREHVSDDSIGKHTIPEDLDTGDYVRVGAIPIDDDNNNLWCYVVGVTRDYTDNFRFVGGKIYNGIYSGMRYFACMTTPDVQTLIEKYDAYPDDIQQIFVCPRKIAGISGSGSTTTGIVAIAEGVGATQLAEKLCSRPNTLDGYTPRHKKLLTYPYQYLLADNQCGAATDYHYEKFKDPTNMRFRIYGVCSPGVPRILMPFDYGYSADSGLGYTDTNTPYCLTLGRYPTCNWSTDTYTAWLVHNQKNLDLAMINGYVQTATGALSTISNVLSGGTGESGATGIYNGAMSIANVMANKYQHSFLPNQSKGNANCGDVITSMYMNKPILQSMQIKREYAEIIDDYFHMFGYKVNKVKLPNKEHRGRWWYTKTIDVNIDGPIPNKDMQELKDCYNRGITFWRNSEEIQNYSLSNGISLTSGAVTDDNWRDKV